MKSKLRLCVTILSSILILALFVVGYKFILAKVPATDDESPAADVESAAPATENDMAEVKLQIPESASIAGLSAGGDLISVTYLHDNIYHVAVFSEDGTLLSEPFQSTDPVSAVFVNSGELTIRGSDVLEVWDTKTDTKVCSYDMEEGAIQDADGQAVWHTETIEKNNEVEIPTTYIAKAVRVSSDGTQSTLEMPDGVTTLLYADDPYLYYEREFPEYKKIVCRINVDTQETTEYTDWVRGKALPIGHLSELFQSEVLMPWEDPNQMFVSNHAEFLARDGAVLLLRGDESICVVDAETQMLLAEIPYDGEIVASSVNEENHYFVLADSSSATVHHWEGEGTATDMAERIDLANLSDAIQSQREDLLSLYGITVTNDETIVAEYYQAEALTSDLRSYVAGIELTHFFALLPQGMTDEMRPASIQTFPICLTGSMTCAGLSAPYEESYYMALDVNFMYGSFLFTDPSDYEISPMLDVFPHEFMHMMEYRIRQTTLPDGEPLLSLWDTVVPPEEDESFTGTYEGEMDERNSLDSDDPPDEIWFEAGYSRTLPEEDRATLFACLFSGVHENGAGWDVYPHLLEKGKLLCTIIREAYPSVNASPESSMYWERNF